MIVKLKRLKEQKSVQQKEHTCLKTILKFQQRFISEKHIVNTEEVNKAALSNNDDKTVWASDGITSYPYGYKRKHAKESCLSKVNIND